MMALVFVGGTRVGCSTSTSVYRESSRSWIAIVGIVVGILIVFNSGVCPIRVRAALRNSEIYCFSKISHGFETEKKNCTFVINFVQCCAGEISRPDDKFYLECCVRVYSKESSTPVIECSDSAK